MLLENNVAYQIIIEFGLVQFLIRLITGSCEAYQLCRHRCKISACVSKNTCPLVAPESVLEKRQFLRCKD